MTDTRAEYSFLYGDRCIRLESEPLLNDTADALVCEVDRQLQAFTPKARDIRTEAGEELINTQCTRILQEYGELETGMAVYTEAGKLPCLGLIHAVSGTTEKHIDMEDISLAVSRSLLVCDANNWSSICLPPLGLAAGLSPADCARAFHRAVTRYWDARLDSSVEQVTMVLDHALLAIFNEIIVREESGSAATVSAPDSGTDEKLNSREPEIGVVELNPAEEPETGDIADWFK